MNPRYLAGATFERRVKKALEASGWLVVRAAGSHGIDLVAVRPGRLVLISCKKNGSISVRERAELANTVKRFVGGLNVEGYVARARSASPSLGGKQGIWVKDAQRWGDAWTRLSMNL